MNFISPKTKDEMYDTLQSIFYYYRIKREAWDNVELSPLVIERLNYMKKTSQELDLLAEKLLASKKAREIAELKQSLETSISTKTNIKEQKQVQLANGKQQIEETYAKVKKDYLNWATDRGIATSEIVAKTLADYDLQMSDKINAFSLPISTEIATLEGEISVLLVRLNGVNTAFDEIYELEKQAKASELALDDEKIARDVFKYNNSASEKEQRYLNSVKEITASLEIKYLQIDEKLFNKEQLIEMGYYNDVIKCVNDYYNTLDAEDAYLDILQESKLVVYLEDYYQSVVYTYRCKAGQ